jgi:hypothetical protein
MKVGSHHAHKGIQLEQRFNNNNNNNEIIIII